MSDILPAVGAIYHGSNRCSFSLWAPLKEKVELFIKENPERNIPMNKNENGVWSVEIDEIEPLTRYFFRIDQKVLPDPASRFQPEGVHGPSAVVTQGFSWTDETWNGTPMKEMVIYELHVGTFTSAGTFDGVISKLPYLQELGVNTIELMPLAQFPGNRNWGYDGVFPFAVQNSYGGPDGLKKLVNEAHRHGIAVLLDVVYNHQGPEGNYFSEFAPYFSDRYKTFWGSAINFDDAYCDGVRNFYWQNALMWLDEFRIDGLRLDAVHAIWDFSARHFIEELTTKVKTLEEKSGRHKVLIAEFDLNNPRYIADASIGGYGMDGQWIDEFHHALHSLLTGEKDGYYEDFGSPQHLAKALKDSYVYTGQYSIHRKKYFGKSADKNSYDQFVVFAQNHDQVGNRMLGDRLSTQLSFEQLKLAAATVLLAPQVPMLFMGEEYGEKNPFQYFISHTDEKLVAMVREGRKKEFAYFNWQGEVPDPHGEKTFRDCILSWNYAENQDQKKLLQYYRHLILFRKERPAMKGTFREDVTVLDPGKSRVIAFERNFQGDHLLIILNFDQSTVPFHLAHPHTKAKKIFDSSALEWRGPGEMAPSLIYAPQTILMHPHSALIFEF
jgi:maltooligosyltrehalose trehalohydrolase